MTMKTHKSRFGFTWLAACLFVSSLVVIYGCEDFLVGNAQGVLDDNTLANQNGVEGNLISAYSMLDGFAFGNPWPTAASNWVFGNVAADDAYKGSEPGDQPEMTDIEFYQWSTGGTDSYMNAKWSNLYEAVNRTNATLRLLAQVEDISDADRNRIRGEALFLRAHYHFEAWKMWENIPYYTEDDDDFRKSNVNVDAIGLILSDLDTAIDLLPQTQSQVGRVTEWTARAYKGRVQVYSGDYPGGLTTLRDVVNNGPYALENNYHLVFTALYSNGPETVLAYQASTNDGEPNGERGNHPDRLAFPHGGSPFGCCGFNQPSQNLVNFFLVDGNGLPLPLTSPNTWNDRNENLDATATEAVDPRLDWTVGRDGVPYKDWGPHNPNYIRDRAWAGPYSPKKNIYERNSDAMSNVGWNNTHLHNMNLHLYRYADVMLLLAEAEVEAGSLENARDLVNQIRERAGVAAQGPGNDASDIAVPIDDPSITWANYNIGLYNDPWADQNVARNAVRIERRLELAMEGHRLFDLRRWGVAADVLNDYVSVERNRRQYLTGAAQYQDRHQRYPIPSIQIQLSRVEGEDRLVQNSGW
jgi:starch-binding outer membrane protein, SusD/RagB family